MADRMYELWVGYSHWSEEMEQEHEDRRALRIITCPRKACRRTRLCGLLLSKTHRCPGFVTWPELDRKDWVPLLRAMFTQDLAECEAEDQEHVRALTVWRQENKKRRQALAWERARETMRASQAAPAGRP